MRIATWNVNSIRSRIDRVVAWLERTDTDVLAIQETKCRDDQFPFEQLAAAGYEVAHVGLNQWNGVAIVSRVGLEDVATSFADSQPLFADVLEARSIGATCGGVRVWSFYVPNGRELDHAHYEYKLQWLQSLRAAAASWLDESPSAEIVLGGDWNVAPLDEDVWDPAFFADKTHTSAPEREAFNAVLDAGYADLVRPHAPGPGVYTFWDYQQLRFQKKEGMRIDFLLGSPALADRVHDAHIDRDERKGKGASDHAPVVIDIT
jgi:exodeoxyribonuclease III